MFQSKRDGQPIAVSVVIPTLNGAEEIRSILDSLSRQTVLPIEILVVDSGSDDCTCLIAAEYECVSIVDIERSSFNHGGTRHDAFERAKGEFVLFLTQDSIPADSFYIEKIIEPLIDDDDVAMVYGRQLAKENARPSERLVRAFNYPSESIVKDSRALDKYGVKAYFASNSCSAYRRKHYEEVGGFLRPCSTNEDMFMAAKLINSGFKVAYSAKACVYHSHNLTLREQYRRNYTIGYALEEHRDILGPVSETSEGVQLLRFVSRGLLRERRLVELLYFVLECCFRFLGNRKGGHDARRCGS